MLYTLYNFNPGEGELKEIHIIGENHSFFSSIGESLKRLVSPVIIVPNVYLTLDAAILKPKVLYEVELKQLKNIKWLKKETLN